MMRPMTMLLSIGGLALASASEEGTTLTIAVGLQTGFFQTGKDIGEMNAHDYRPGEFVTNDFIYEGLVAWDPADATGIDGITGNMDDFIKGSLAESWSTNYDAAVADSSTKFEITFNLRAGVTFHDGEAWNAAACKANIDQIMGGDGSSGGVKAMMGMHDWLGFTQNLDGWSVVDDMTFKLTFTTFYEGALRELSTIRPFRFVSPLVLPDMSAGELSHNRWRGSYARYFPHGCGPPQNANWQQGDPDCYVMRGISAPIGTGPYKVVHKSLLNAAGETQTLLAADFNASCYERETCTYDNDMWVSEVKFEKFAAHRSSPTYDNVVLRAYNTHDDVKAALQNGTLDVAYGVNTLMPSAFVALASAEEGAGLVAHKATHDINTRLIVLNSGGRLNTLDLRKLVMGILEAGRQMLYDGELSEEEPMDTLFDPSMPHCAVLSTLSSSAAVAATKSASVTTASITQPLRFLYKYDVPHEAMVASWVISTLYTAGVDVVPMPVTKAVYNNMHCSYLTKPTSEGGFGYYWYSYDQHGGNLSEANGLYPDDNYMSWDIAFSETWGPPYDPTSKLWDMTHGQMSGWCSQEADAPAVSNMESMTLADFATKVRALSNEPDLTTREGLYTEVLTTLHDEAIFLPLTARRQTAVTSTKVAGFEFGWSEFDLPLANLHPASDSDDMDAGVIAAIAIGAGMGALLCGLLIFTCMLISKEKRGTPMFTSMVIADAKPQA